MMLKGVLDHDFEMMIYWWFDVSSVDLSLMDVARENKRVCGSA